MRRRSMARSSVDNVCTVLRVRLQIEASDFHVHVNFPGGAPVDGPSAGLAMAVAVLSAIRDIPIDNRLAMTGEISVHGRVKPVGGVVAKVAAAVSAGAVRVLIPRENWQDRFTQVEGCKVIAVDDIDEASSWSGPARRFCRTTRHRSCAAGGGRGQIRLAVERWIPARCDRRLG